MICIRESKLTKHSTIVYLRLTNSTWFYSNQILHSLYLSFKILLILSWSNKNSSFNKSEQFFFERFWWFDILLSLLKISDQISDRKSKIGKHHVSHFLYFGQDPWLYTLNPLSATPQNGQTRSNNSSAICRRTVWVCLSILCGWCLKG